MNIVFIIGNGFDLNLGLKTSYRDFYKYYVDKVGSSEVLVTELKNRIRSDSDIETWADLECALGNYTTNFQSQEEFDRVFFDIVENLGRYLQTEQDKISTVDFDSEIFFSDLISPERVLPQRDQDALRTFTESRERPFNINILTFNYTTTIEHIVGENPNNLPIGTKDKSQVYLRSIEHIHQYIGQSLVLGVNDVNQIKNEELRQSQEVIEAFVKPLHNQAQGHTRDNYCMQTISKANLVFIFGSSIGETDKIWWEAIGERLGDSCRLVIFRHENDNSNHIAFRIRENRILKDRFLSMTNLSKEQKEAVQEAIYVGVTEDLFSLT